MIKLENVTKRFGDYAALDDVSLEIGKGTAYGLLGSNGAGKSTMLRLIAGIYRPDKGSVTADGKPIFDNAAAKSGIFFINDETVQLSSFTLKTLKEYYRGFYPHFSEEVFTKLNESVRLPEKKRISEFSKGMKRQAAVIVGLSCCTDYLLIDEAFDGLDPTMRIIVKRMLVDAMLDRKMTVVISSHNLKEINEICDRAALIHNGRIVFSREIDSVKSDIRKVQASFPKEYSREDLRFDGLLHYERVGSVYYLVIKGDEESIRQKLAPYSPGFADIVPLTLEEIFIYEMEGKGYDANSIGGTESTGE